MPTAAQQAGLALLEGTPVWKPLLSSRYTRCWESIKVEWFGVSIFSLIHVPSTFTSVPWLMYICDAGSVSQACLAHVSACTASAYVLCNMYSEEVRVFQAHRHGNLMSNDIYFWIYTASDVVYIQYNITQHSVYRSGVRNHPNITRMIVLDLFSNVSFERDPEILRS